VKRKAGSEEGENTKERRDLVQYNLRDTRSIFSEGKIILRKTRGGNVGKQVEGYVFVENSS